MTSAHAVWSLKTCWQGARCAPQVFELRHRQVDRDDVGDLVGQVVVGRAAVAAKDLAENGKRGPNEAVDVDDYSAEDTALVRALGDKLRVLVAAVGNDVTTRARGRRGGRWGAAWRRTGAWSLCGPCTRGSCRRGAARRAGWRPCSPHSHVHAFACSSALRGGQGQECMVENFPRASNSLFRRHVVPTAAPPAASFRSSAATAAGGADSSDSGRTAIGEGSVAAPAPSRPLRAPDAGLRRAGGELGGHRARERGAGGRELGDAAVFRELGARGGSQRRRVAVRSRAGGRASGCTASAAGPYTLRGVAFNAGHLWAAPRRVVRAPERPAACVRRRRTVTR